MRWITLFIILAQTCSGVAHADCAPNIAVAMRRANALPPSSGRAALLEQIQRADVAHHEGDEGECNDQLSEAVSVLDQIDAAKRQANTGK